MMVCANLSNACLCNITAGWFPYETQYFRLYCLIHKRDFSVLLFSVFSPNWELPIDRLGLCQDRVGGMFPDFRSPELGLKGNIIWESSGTRIACICL